VYQLLGLFATYLSLVASIADRAISDLFGVAFGLFFLAYWWARRPGRRSAAARRWQAVRSHIRRR